jgi:hypothetical protein
MPQIDEKRVFNQNSELFLRHFFLIWPYASCKVSPSGGYRRQAYPAGTCILFGDGCGAVVLTAQQGECALLGSSMCSDGLGQKHLKARSSMP